MLLNLIAVVVLGVAVAGVLALAFRLFGVRAPRWLLPAAAGFAMMTYTVWDDYTWYARTAGAFSEDIRVARAYEATSPLRPWTYLAAPVDRFVAVGRTARAEGRPGYVLAEVLIQQRYRPTVVAQMLYDCAGDRRADAVDVQGFDAAGAPIGGPWEPLPEDDPLRPVVCAGDEPPAA